jgi:hypothetical protein
MDRARPARSNAAFASRTLRSRGNRRGPVRQTIQVGRRGVSRPLAPVVEEPHEHAPLIAGVLEGGACDAAFVPEERPLFITHAKKLSTCGRKCCWRMRLEQRCR